MGITIRGHHGLQAGTTAVSPSPPGGTTTGDVEVIWTTNKNPSSTPTSPPPANGVGTWALEGQGTVGTGADGAGIGQMLISVWSRELTGTGVGTTVSIPGANCSMGGGVVASKGGGDPAWDITVSFGSDTSSGTGFSATVADNLNLAVGEVLVSVGFFTANTSLPGRGLTIPGVTSTLTGVDSGGTANGNDMFGWTDRRVSTAGTQSGASTTTATAGAATTGGCVHIRIGLATSINLVVDAASQAQAADSPSLTQVHALVADAAVQSQASGSPTLSQVHVLTVAPSTQAQAADSPTLSVVSALVVQDAAQSQTSDSPALMQVHNLSVDSAAQAQGVESLSLTQAHSLAVSDAAQGQVASVVDLSQVHGLTVQDAAQVHAADEVSLTADGTLAVADAVQAQISESVELSQVHELVTADVIQQQSADEVTLSQVHVLQVASASQAQTVDAITIATVGAYVPPADVTATVLSMTSAATPRDPEPSAVARQYVSTATARSPE